MQKLSSNMLHKCWRKSKDQKPFCYKEIVQNLKSSQTMALREMISAASTDQPY